ncbi:MAG: response regulator [Desulfobulbaceae bacterium]|nr:response regulator [Desulfobulbaceae bacterium]
MTEIKVLIVDDETEFAATLAERLQLRKMSTRVAAGAAEALAILGEGWQPDVVLLDLKMPGLDGLQTLTLLKQQDPAMEVILVSGHGSTSAGMEGMQKGLFDYLLKPVDIGVVVEKIGQAYRKRTKLPADRQV